MMMNRLQKKCLYASTAVHAVLGLILVFSAAFVASEHPPKDLPPLMLVPSQLIDDALAAAPQAPATPPTEQSAPPQPEPTPPTPRPVEPTPRRTPPEPEPRRVEPRPERTESTPAPPPKPRVQERPRIQPSFTRSNDDSQSRAREQARREAARQRQISEAKQRASQFEQLQSRLNSGLTSQRTLDLEGLTGAAFASYGQEVLRIYREAWRPPDELNDDTATATVKITVLRNGTIRSAKIVSRSGNSTLDNSVQEALNRVRRLPPFPSGSSDSERVFSINFNLKSIRQF